MTIVQVGQYPIYTDCIRGGVEASVFGLAQELAKGHEVHVFDIPRIGGADIVEQEGNLIVHRYKNPGTHNKDAVTRVDEIVQEIVAIHPDVVHVHGTGKISAEMYFAVKRIGLPVMLTIHGLLRVEKKNALVRAISTNWKKVPKALYQYIYQSRVECKLLEEADRAIVDTSYLLEALNRYPLRRLPELHVIPQGADENYFGNEIPDSKSNRILCVGTFSKRKSQVLLIKAFERLRDKGVNAQLVLCGVIAEADYFKEVQNAIAVSRYANDIHLYVDKPQEFILKEYYKARVFALHSQEESQGIVFAEAMAMGLPVVSTRVGGIPYVVEDGKTGILTEYGDVASTAKALEKLLSDFTLYKEYSNTAIKASQKYRWENIANKILKLYQA